jgi:Tol biopolymer transport system component
MDVVFSSDNRQIAYVRRNQDVHSLRVAPVDGAGERTVFRHDHGFGLKGWFPDGARILIQTRLGTGPVSLYAVSIADGSTKLIKQGEDNKLINAWMSPDGRYVAHCWVTNRNPWAQSIRVLNLADMSDVAVVDHPSDNGAPRFTPQNKGLVFFSDRRGTRDLWYQPLSEGRPSGGPELIKAELGNIEHPIGMTNDGTLHFRGSLELVDTYAGEIDLATGTWVHPTRKLSPANTGRTSAPAFSDDGQWLAYTRRARPRHWEPLSLVLRSLATGEEKEVPTDLGWVEWQRWFPDGKSLLVQGQTFADPRYGIYRFDLATRRSTFLRDSSRERGNSAAIDRDGKTVYVPLLSTGGARLIAWNLETGAERGLVTGEWVSVPSLSPDGRSLAFARSEGKTNILETIGTDGSSRRELYRSQVRPDGTGIVKTPIWLQDGRSILFHAGGGGWPAGMQRIPVEGGTPQDIGLRNSGERLGGGVWATMHSAGRHFAIDAGIQRDECYALENFIPPGRAAR